MKKFFCEAVVNQSGAMKAETIAKIRYSPKNLISKRLFYNRWIITIIMLYTLLGILSSQNHVSNIRTQQHDAMLYVTYDLEVTSDIELFVSFDNGVNYTGPLQQVSGAIGKGILPEKNKILVWNIFNEVGYIDKSDIVIKIVSNAAVSTENMANAIIAIEQPQKPQKELSPHSKFYLGLTGGIVYRFIEPGYGRVPGVGIGLHGAYFFNHQLGFGFVLHNKQTRFRYYDKTYDTYEMLYTSSSFLGTVFYGNWGHLYNGKLFFPTCIGIGYYEISHLNRREGLGFLFSGGIAYKPKSLISIGLNNRLYVKANQNLIHTFDYSMIGFFLDINFHF